MYSDILLHIPHNACAIPEDLGNKKDDAFLEMMTAAFYMIDYYTFPLFVPEQDMPHVTYYEALWNRILVDMERMVNDPLESKGWGIVSQYGRNWLGDNWAETTGRNYYDTYHSLFAKTLRQLNHPLLIDCHSFSAHPTPLCPEPPQDIDICIGFNEDETRPSEDIIRLVQNHLQSRGYRIGINTPYSNSKTVDGVTGYHSLMLEVSKSLYMDEETIKPTDGFDRLQRDIQAMYPMLLNNH